MAEEPYEFEVWCYGCGRRDSGARRSADEAQRAVEEFKFQHRRDCGDHVSLGSQVKPLDEGGTHQTASPASG